MNKLIFNFSGLYASMDLLPKDFEMIDCTGIRGAELYIDEEAEGILQKLIDERGAEGIHLVDNGNYHYMTRLFLKTIGEPFDLLYFDNHSDDQPPAFEGLHSCGSWVLDARESIGALCNITWVDGNGKIHSSGKEASEDRPLYISVDKDVLSKEEVPTNWDQGILSLKQIYEIADKYIKGRRLIGADICGGCVSTDGIFPSEDLIKNEAVDLELIKYFLSRLN